MQSQSNQPTSEIYTTQTTNNLEANLKAEARIYAKEQMHKYVGICLGALLVFIATFPIAYYRVSQSGKYNGGAFNTQKWEDSQR